MRVFITRAMVALLMLLAIHAFAAEKSDKAAEKNTKAAVHLKIDSAAQLPKTLEQGQLISTDSKNSALSESILNLVDQAAETKTSAACSVTCPHEVGGIECPIGHACSCGCPGGYASCECK